MTTHTSPADPSTPDAGAILECPHGIECGACALLGQSYDAQLRRKRRFLGDALQSYRKLARAEVLDCMESPLTSGYRNRAKMAVGISKYDPTSLGYFREGTREIIDAPHCKVLVPELLETTRALRDFLRSASIPRELRHIDVRCGSDPKRQHLILVLRTDERLRLPIEGLRRACRHVDGISVNLNPKGGAQVIKGPIHHQWGAREVFVERGPLSLRVSPGSFFQVNLSVLPRIHAVMGEFLDGGDVLADLYSGVGTHGLALADRFSRVVCVEGVRSSVADTKASAKRARLGHVSVIPKPVERSLKPLLDADPDSVVMNPSRAGARPEVLDALLTSRADRIVYLSCDPRTLGRDLDVLVRGGFELVSTQPIDMMPQTRQVEAIALLARRR